jgi:thiosulfate/3-mercaptopyruvate sulfurtransferase
MRTPLVSTDWLAARLGAPDLVVLDAAWAVPEAAMRGAEIYRAGHIPGARHVDLDVISDPTSPYANMLPSAGHFAAIVGALGVDAGKTVVVYDAGYVAARLRWMFRHFGHDAVAILDGGLGRWRAEGRPIETGPGETGLGETGFGEKGPGEKGPGDPAIPARLVARPRNGAVVGLDEMRTAVAAGAAQIVDARSPSRFSGDEPSGYPGVPGGHMPGAVNVPWSGLLRTAAPYGFVDPDATRAQLRAAGLDLDRPIIATCGSGVTACIVLLALERLGLPPGRLYDGSWHEWAQQPDTPKIGPGAGGV